MSTRKLLRSLWWVAAALVLLAHLALAWRSLTEARFWEDEAYNLTVPRNLVLGLGYASDGLLDGHSGTVSHFDHRISTGAAVLLPTSLVLWLGSLFGLEFWGMPLAISARIVPLAYWGLLIAGLFVLGRRISGRWGAIIAAAMSLTFTAANSNSPLQGPADLLGEVPAAALLVWALIALRRRPWLAGLCFGLAVQAKYIALLAGPGLVIAALIMSELPLRQWWRTLRAPAIFTVLPTLCIELFALVALGPREFFQHVRRTGKFMLDGGQEGFETTLGEKLGTLLGSWFVPVWLAATVAVLGAVLVAAAFLQLRRHPESLQSAQDAISAGTRWPLAQRRELLALLLAALLGAFAFIGWWSTARHTPLWVRHPAPGVYAYLPVLAAFLPLSASVLLRRAAGSASVAARMVGVAFALALTGLLAFGASAHLRQAYGPQWIELPSQVGAATVMRETLQQRGVTDDDWVALPYWGHALSIVVLAGPHAYLGEGEFFVTEQECTPGVQVLESGGYRLCEPAQ